jgi:outer membrane protein TolC
MKRKFAVCCLCLCASFWKVDAQEIMTLEKCRESALEHNRTIAVAAFREAQAEDTRKAYRANFFPKISATGDYLYTHANLKYRLAGNYLPTFVPDPVTGQLQPNVLLNPVTGEPVIGADGNPVFKQYAYFPDMNLSLRLSGAWMAGVRAEVPVYSGGKIASGYRMAKTGSEMATLNVRLTRIDVLVRTDEAYWMHVQAQELLKLALSYRRVVTELLRNVQNAQQVGLKHANDVLKVQVKLNEAEVQLLRAQDGVTLSRKNLCHTIGLPLDSLLVLPETGEESSSVAVVAAADYAERPEWLLLEQQVRLKEQQIQLTQSDFLPQIGLLAQYGYVNGPELNGARLSAQVSFSVLASVRIPLFHGGEGRHKIRAAQAERDAARLEREHVGEQLALELARAVDQCNESMLEVELTARSLQQAEENQKLSGLQYEAGMETLSDYLEAQAAWQQARTEYVKAQTRRRMNETYYLRAAGRL